MSTILQMPPNRDPRQQPVKEETPLPNFSGDCAASVWVPLVAGDLVNAHFAYEQWGTNRDPNRWNHPVYRKAAERAIRSCSEVAKHSAR
jgi:hypothetical protein